MIETFGDMIAMIAMVLFILIGFWMLYAITIRHREEDMKRREALYYRYYSEAEDDDSDFDDRNEPYYED
jgi:ABC-type nickel/cobalt efflux system permease component RcnA